MLRASAGSSVAWFSVTIRLIVFSQFSGVARRYEMRDIRILSSDFVTAAALGPARVVRDRNALVGRCRRTRHLGRAARCEHGRQDGTNTSRRSYARS